MMKNLERISTLGISKKRKFGSVYLCKHAANDSLYILKTSDKSQISERTLVQIRNEALFSFTHTGLPKIHSFYEDELSTNLVLEYKRGVDLATYWSTLKKRKRLDFCKKMVAKLLAILDIIHAQNTFHCDIKPSNILIADNEVDFDVYLIDFGLALDKNNPDCYNRKLVFPLGYAAPELILNQLQLVGPQTDYFALGITLFNLWTGTLPLSHPNPSIYTNLQLAHPLPSNTAMSKGMNLFVQQLCIKPFFPTAPNLMEKDQMLHILTDAMSKRPSNSQEIVQAIERIQPSFFWK